MSLLEVAGVRRSFGGVHAVDGVDLAVDESGILGLIGPNGAGKTTLLNLITGHVRPDDGSIRLEGEDIGGRGVHSIARRGVARTFQNLRLYRELTAIDNVVIGMHAHRRSLGRGARATCRAQAAELLGRVGLDPARHGRSRAGDLSYGDQRRLEVARALALRPRLLLLDEPVAGMNAVEKDRMAELLRSLAAERTLAIVLIEHDLRLVMGVCSRVAVMDFGRKIADGPPAEIAEDPAVVAAYLGRASARARPAPPADKGGVLLAVEDLDVSYGAVDAVRGVTLEVAAGEVVTLIGANGAGKTTVLRTLSGLVRARGGRARFGELDLRAAAPDRIVAAGLVQVPEGREILGGLTVEENLSLGAWCRSDKRAVAIDLEAQFDRFPVLAARRRLVAGQLSGGEQQMLAIGRALMAAPRMLLLDEPSLGLAPQLVDEVFDLIGTLATEGMTILLVEQNAMQALRLASRAYVLESGVVTVSAPSQSLLDDPQVQASYLGT